MKADARDLIRRAINARHRRKDWRAITLAELKTRLLAADGTFSERAFGVASFTEFVRNYPDLLRIESTGGAATVRFIEHDTITTAAPPPAPAQTPTAVNKENLAALDHFTSKGDRLGIGELLAGSLSGPVDEQVIASIVVNWASSSSARLVSPTLDDIVQHSDDFAPEHLALATVHVAARMRNAGLEYPTELRDLAFRLTKDISKLFGDVGRGRDALNTAVALLDEEFTSLIHAVGVFTTTTATTAKAASIDLVRRAHKYAALALPAERPLIGQVDLLLGPTFRKFCESCERAEAQHIPQRATQLLTALQRFQSSYEKELPYRAWRKVLAPLSSHIASLLDEAMATTDRVTAPALSHDSSAYKLNLAVAGSVTFPVRIRNQGQGTAYEVTFKSPSAQGLSLTLADPSPFDLLAEGERLVNMLLTIAEPIDSTSIPVSWSCTSANGRAHTFEQSLLFEQQRSEPNWEALLANPPYTINPIKTRKGLFGRDTTIGDLHLHTLAGTSLFLWGQKRVGKTSVLQVLGAELSERKNVIRMIFRMGELIALHEGQIAHTIAERLASALGEPMAAPSEDHFGAGLSKLVPHVEALASRHPDKKLLVVIDEFDDLDSAFYTGERGKQFVKALRSLSEVGLTFFFVGSERMDAIYKAHALDLNKWLNISLDYIHSEADCAALITEPVSGVIEYQPAAIRTIVAYCKGNPFYMHLLCNALFRRCWRDHRTFVSESDVEDAKKELLRTLSPINFAHFWDDNPELELEEKQRQAAQNCCFLACMSALSGTYESLEEIHEAQELLKLPEAKRLTRDQIRNADSRLRRRRVISKRPFLSGCDIELPMFREWLAENSISHLLPIWQEHCDRAQTQGTPQGIAAASSVDQGHFPIQEDDLLVVCENLIYLGKQVDVANARRWLRQFDDDNRIEIAFLLLKRLAEKGISNEGAAINALARMQEAVGARRLEIGDKQWTVMRRRLDNLCITFVDSETKSGAVLARELAKRLGPGKCGAAHEIQSWLSSHDTADPMLVVVDDFAGTGSTLVKGLDRLCENKVVQRFAKEGRVLCCLQSAFPEAIEKLKQKHPNVNCLVIRTFGDDVRALDDEAGIFADPNEVRFAKEVLLQLGRQLTPQAPLGFGDMGALVAFYNTIPNNTLPIFWSNGTVNGKPWVPLFQRVSF